MSRMLSRRNRKTFELLKEIAICIPPSFGQRITAAIVYKNRIISIGTNSYKSNPFQKRFANREGRIYFHAETAAIKNALRHVSVDALKYCTLLVCRVSDVNNNPRFSLAKPCAGCQQAIAEFDIKKTFYSVGEGEFALL